MDWTTRERVNTIEEKESKPLMSDENDQNEEWSELGTTLEKEIGACLPVPSKLRTNRRISLSELFELKKKYKVE